MGIRQLITLVADGKAAAREIGKLDKQVEGVDDAAKGVNFDELAQSAEKAGVATGGITDALTGSAGAVVGVGALLGGLVAAGLSAAETAIEVDVLATALDTNVQTASRLRAVFAESGIEARDLTDIALQITGALDGNEEAAGKLGLTLAQAQDPVTALKAGIENWDLLTATERAQAFGEEGVRQIAAIVARGEDLEDLLANVDPGLIFDTSEIAAAREFKEEMQQASASLDAAKTTLGQSIIPILKVAADLTNEWIGADKQREYNAALLTSTGVMQDLAAAALDVGLAQSEVTDEAETLEDQLLELGSGGAAAFNEIAAAADDARTGALADWKRSLNVEKEADAAFTALSDAWGGSEEATDDAEAAVLQYLTALGDVPAETITTIRAAFAAGDLTTVERELEQLTRDRFIDVQVRLQGRSSLAGGANIPIGASSTTVNITMAGPVSSRELGNQVAYWQNNG